MWQKSKDKKKCIACNKSESELSQIGVSISLVGKKMGICDKCKKTNSNLYLENSEEKDLPSNVSRIGSHKKKNYQRFYPGTPRFLYNKVDRFVSGHEKAKKILSVAFSNHNKRIAGENVPKETILLAGRTGMGKTLLLKSMAKAIEVKLTIVDSSSLTGAGWVGADVQSALEQLYISCNKDLKSTQQGIIVFDEFDKKCQSNNQKHGSIDTVTVQEQLLKMIEGGKFLIGKDNNKIEIDTTNIMFVLSGSFEKQIDSTIKDTKGIGLVRDGRGKICKKNNYEDDWFTNIGIIKELLGRVSNIVRLGNLTKQETVEAFTKKKDCAFELYKNLCASYGVTLELSKSMIDHISKEITQSPLGVRVAARIISERIHPILFDAHIYINETIILYPSKVQIKK